MAMGKRCGKTSFGWMGRIYRDCATRVSAGMTSAALFRLSGIEAAGVDAGARSVFEGPSRVLRLAASLSRGHHLSSHPAGAEAMGAPGRSADWRRIDPCNTDL